VRSLWIPKNFIRDTFITVQYFQHINELTWTK